MATQASELVSEDDFKPCDMLDDVNFHLAGTILTLRQYETMARQDGSMTDEMQALLDAMFLHLRIVSRGLDMATMKAEASLNGASPL